MLPTNEYGNSNTKTNAKQEHYLPKKRVGRKRGPV